MDWTRAIERNREALEAVIATIAALLAMAEGASRMSWPLYRAVLRVLHPAEAALRRLIVIVARGLVVKPGRTRPMTAPPTGRGKGRRLSFRLFDPRKRYSLEPRVAAAKFAPRIHVFQSDPRVAALWRAPEPPPAPPPVHDDGLADARRLELRFAALKLAFADLPRQARRLVRLRARRSTNPALPFKSPLRPGPPPGHRRKATHDIDFVLRECHAQAFDALAADTS